MSFAGRSCALASVNRSKIDITQHSCLRACAVTVSLRGLAPSEKEHRRRFSCLRVCGRDRASHQQPAVGVRDTTDAHSEHVFDHFSNSRSLSASRAQICTIAPFHADGSNPLKPSQTLTGTILVLLRGAASNAASALDDAVAYNWDG